MHICFSQEMNLSECLAHSGWAINICRMKKGTPLTHLSWLLLRFSLFLAFLSLLKLASSLSHSQFLSPFLIPPSPSLPLCHSLFSFCLTLTFSSYTSLLSFFLPPFFFLIWYCLPLSFFSPFPFSLIGISPS